MRRVPPNKKEGVGKGVFKSPRKRKKKAEVFKERNKLAKTERNEKKECLEDENGYSTGRKERVGGEETVRRKRKAQV